MWVTKLRPILCNGLWSSQFVYKSSGKHNTLAVFPVHKCTRRTYKNFGHQKDPPEHPLKNCYLLVAMGLVIYNFIDFKK